jgi:hypothetical protein
VPHQKAHYLKQLRNELVLFIPTKSFKTLLQSVYFYFAGHVRYYIRKYVIKNERGK